MKSVSQSRRRPRSTSVERAQWVQRFYQSGLAQREYAARQGLRLSTLQRWVAENPSATPGPAFAEVRLAGRPASWAAEVVRADGAVLRLSPEAPALWLQHFLGAC